MERENTSLKKIILKGNKKTEEGTPYLGGCLFKGWLLFEYIWNINYVY